MGMNNRQRRADKRRRGQRQQQRGHGWGPSSRPFGFGTFDDGDGGGGATAERDDVLPLSLGDVIVAAASAAARGMPEAAMLLDDVARRATRRNGADAGEVSAELTGQAQRVVAQCWDLGWQPADLVHVVARRHKAVHRELTASIVALDADGYRDRPGADGGWMAQVDAVTDGATAPRPDALLADWTARAGDLRAALLMALEVLGTLLSLPRQPLLCPPPSEWTASPTSGPTGQPGTRAAGGAGGASGAADPKLIERVRALLAKAESTDFPEEAEAFTAKAQELIARHTIDIAMLRGAQERDGSGPKLASNRRVLIDDPYGRAKSLLVGVVARANRCTAVWDPDLSITTLFGSTSDLDAVELLYTSLLTQATAAMVHAGRDGARSRSRGFRSSFLVAYASRIGERLDEATQSAVAEAEATHGAGVLPVLASQQAAAEEARDEFFPHLGRAKVTTRNAAGWFAGRAAAESARLGPDTSLTPG